MWRLIFPILVLLCGFDSIAHAQPVDSAKLQSRADLSNQWWKKGLQKMQAKEFDSALEAFVTRRTKHPYPHPCGTGAASDAYLHTLYEGYCLEKLGRFHEAALRYIVGAHEPGGSVSGANLLRLAMLYRNAGRTEEFVRFVRLVQKRKDDFHSQIDSEYSAQWMKGSAKRPLNQMARLARLESQRGFRGIVVATLDMTTPPNVEPTWGPLEPFRNVGPLYATQLIKCYSGQLVPLFEQRMKTASPREQSALLIALALSGSPQAADVVARRAEELRTLMTHHELAWNDSFHATTALALSGKVGRSTVETWTMDKSPGVSSMASSALLEAQQFSDHLVVFIPPIEVEFIRKTAQSGLPSGDELWKSFAASGGV